MPTLADQFHPRSFTEVVGQPVALSVLDGIRNRCGTLAGRNYFISGKSGTGKSAIADLIAAEIAHPVCVEKFVGRGLGVDDVRQIRRTMQTRGFAPGGRVALINEAHTLRKPVIEELLDATDPTDFPSHAAFIFTTTETGQARLFEDFDDSRPLLSRCTPIKLTEKHALRPYAERVRKAAQSAELDGQPIDVYERLILDCDYNMREALMRVEAGELLRNPELRNDPAPARDNLLFGLRVR